MHPTPVRGREAGCIVGVMNANAIVIGLIGIVVLLIILRVFGLI
jgi:hypothetical protein